MRLIKSALCVGFLTLGACTQNTLRGRTAPPAPKPTGQPIIAPGEEDGSGVPVHTQTPVIVPTNIFTLPPDQPTPIPTWTYVWTPTNPGSPSPSPSPTPQRSNFFVTLGCDTQNASYAMGANPFNLTAYMQSYCYRTVSTTGPGAPQDFIFVLDLTGSMEPVLSNLLNNIVQFANIVQARNGAARFGAVGFRADGEDVNNKSLVPYDFTSPIGLTSASTFRQRLNSWTIGGGSHTEQGQAGIGKAVDMFLADAQATGQKSTYKNILYISNDFANWKWELPHTIAVDKLITKLRSAKQTLPNLQFFYSVSTKAEHDYGIANDGRKAQYDNSPRKQIEQVANGSGLRGKAYNFPFSESDFLNAFSKDIEGAPVNVSGVCYIKQLKTTDASKSTIYGSTTFNSYSAATAQAWNHNNVNFNRANTVAITKYGGYKVNVSRCCVSTANTNTSCLQTYDTETNFTLK